MEPALVTEHTLVTDRNQQQDRNLRGAAQDGTFMSPSHTQVPDRTAHPACLVVREVLNRVGDKWSVQAIAMLGQGPRRFSELRRSIEGVSQRMLTLTLRGLERDGLVTRTVTPTTPPRVDYALTPTGRTLLVPVMALAEWAQQHLLVIQEARERFDKDHAAEAD
jgi:DNA-binding HxlR family transcriptional regulator